MMSDYEADFFFEEDKIPVATCVDGSAVIAADALNVPINTTKTDGEELPAKESGNDDGVPAEASEDTDLLIVALEDGFESLKSQSCKDIHFFWSENQLGMTITTGSVLLEKDSTNLIGISIGGGAPYCPCLYVVQIFDNTIASKDGTLQSGDEIIGVDSVSVKGKTKSEVAKMIQSSQK